MQQGDLEVSLLRPPNNLYEDWIKQGPMTTLSKKPGHQLQRNELKQVVTEFKSVMKQFKEMNEVAMNMQMQQAMLDATERMNKRTRRTRRSLSSSRSRSPPRRRRRRRRHTPSVSPEPSTKTSRTLSTSQRVVMNFTTSIQRSFSPIGSSLEEIDIAIAFFNWLIRRATRESQQERLRAVHAICEERAFKIKHLKAMSDPTHPMYQRAIVLGIPDGMALDFADNLRLFKQEWRSAQALSSLREG